MLGVKTNSQNHNKREKLLHDAFSDFTEMYQNFACNLRKISTKIKIFRSQHEKKTLAKLKIIRDTTFLTCIIQLLGDAQLTSSFLYQIGSEQEIPKSNRTVIISCTCINNFILHNHTILYGCTKMMDVWGFEPYLPLHLLISWRNADWY